MKAIITVVGKDQKGIVGYLANKIAVTILTISLKQLLMNTMMARIIEMKKNCHIVEN